MTADHRRIVRIVHTRLVRLGLYLAYAVLSFLVFVYYGGAGHGSFAPVPIFLSWGILPVRLIQASFLLLAGPTLYLVLLFRISERLAPRGFRHWLSLPLLHCLGTAVLLPGTEHGHMITPTLLRESILVSVAIVLAFFTAEWYAVRRQLCRNAVPTRSVE